MSAGSREMMAGSAIIVMPSPAAAAIVETISASQNRRRTSVAREAPEREADGVLARSPGRADQHEPGHVGARDEHQYGDGSQPGTYAGAGWPQDVLDDRPDSGLDVALTMCPPRLLGNYLVQVFPCRVDRRVGLQSSERKQHADVEDVNRTVGDADSDGAEIRHEWSPDVGAGWEHERRGHDPHDGECRPTEHDRAIDDAGIAAELALPETVAQDDRSR